VLRVYFFYYHWVQLPMMIESYSVYKTNISHRISYAFILFALITCIGNEIIEVSAIVSIELVKERNKCTYIRCFLYVKIFNY